MDNNSFNLPKAPNFTAYLRAKLGRVIAKDIIKTDNNVRCTVSSGEVFLGHLSVHRGIYIVYEGRIPGIKSKSGSELISLVAELNEGSTSYTRRDGYDNVEFP